MIKTKIIDQYLALNCPVQAGDFAANLSDDQAKEIYRYLCLNRIEKMVTPLYFNYSTQQYRFNLDDIDADIDALIEREYEDYLDDAYEA